MMGINGRPFVDAPGRCHERRRGTSEIWEIVIERHGAPVPRPRRELPDPEQ